MNTIRDLHEQAMDFADQADSAKRKGDSALAKTLFSQALALESQAAQLVNTDKEPTRSILYRSAATLALDCDQNREAERLAAAALAGDPPSDIADELREVLDRANLRRQMGIYRIKQQQPTEWVTIVGLLYYAEMDNEPSIKILDEMGKVHSLVIQKEHMQPIVRRFWAEKVKVTGVHSGRDKIELIDIEPVVPFEVRPAI